MTEMLAVIVIIGILAAVATPSFFNLMRDRRVGRAAQTMVDMIRDSKTRALGRGAAQLIKWDINGGSMGVTTTKGALEQREATVVASPLPATSCLTTVWTQLSTSSRSLGIFNLDNGRQELAVASYFDPTAMASNYGEICFTPRGRAMWRDAAGGAFAVMSGPAHFNIQNSRTGYVRVINILPNGVARLAL